MTETVHMVEKGKRSPRVRMTAERRNQGAGRLSNQLALYAETGNPEYMREALAIADCLAGH